MKTQTFFPLKVVQSLSENAKFLSCRPAQRVYPFSAQMQSKFTRGIPGKHEKAIRDENSR